MALSFRDVLKAREAIKGRVHETPVYTSRSIDRLVGRRIFFKAENLQRTGSFKARGAVYAVSRLLAEERHCPGVITHSSGNHGQALAYAAQMHKLPCTVVVPSNAPMSKRNAILEYGAQVVLCEPTMTSRIETCKQLIEETGKVLIHPHDDFDIMAGQGTIAMEFLNQVPDLQAILVPVGGGGMVGGIATYVKYASPHCKVFCVEPSGKDLEHSLRNNAPMWPDPPGILHTVADGLRVQRLGEECCFRTVADLCEKQVFTVTDDAIIASTKLIWERLKLVIEPSSGVGVAALFTDAFRNLDHRIERVGVVLCGGNIDVDNLPWLMTDQGRVA